MAASAMLLHVLAAGLLYHVVTAAPAVLSSHTPAAAAPPPPPPQPPPAAAPPSSSVQVPIGQVTELQPTRLHGRFLHITDFHPDEFYKVHTSTSEDHACHSGKGPAGFYGAETSDCDAPISLLNATFDWITANIRDEIDFVVWTGDSARHDSDEDIPRSPAQVLGTNRLLADKFAETFSDKQGLTIPVVPNFGNNDILPHNILLPGPNKWLSYYADIWKKFIPEEQRHSFEFGGWFYVEVIPNKLAVFSLNTLYLFDRNAGVDDCQKPSEPGYKHLEWLRIQLQFMRDRGMKAILMGHVPPARTDSKMLWDETCWQKYTLWLRQYRDVVISGLYGHMNIDHFMISDTKDITIDSAEISSEDEDEDEDDDEEYFEDLEDVSPRTHLEDDLSIQSATDYLEELREGWAKLPKVQIESEASFSKKKGGKGKKLGKWAERYQLSFVSPSIVPNYFPTLRIYDYNITGLEDTVTWAEYTKPLPIIDKPEVGAQQLTQDQESELELRSLSDGEAGDIEVAKKKKKKKKKKGKKPKPSDPNLHIPLPPTKAAPPGPAYSPQPLTLLGYKQYYANLTHINNVDIASSSSSNTESNDNADTSWLNRWREGKHGDKKPKSKKPKPREFKFEIEYTTYDDKLYRLKDLTVRSFVDLAYRMGQSAKAKTTMLMRPGGELRDDLDKLDEDDSDVGEVQTDEEDDFEDLENNDVDVQKGKKKGDKKKKKKKKKKKLNKTWLHFLKHAFVSTVDDDELKDKFS